MTIMQPAKAEPLHAVVRHRPDHGDVGDADTQRAVLRAALGVFEKAREPGHVEHLFGETMEPHQLLDLLLLAFRRLEGFALSRRALRIDAALVGHDGLESFLEFTAMANVAAATSSIELGTAVVPTWLRHPLMLAAQALTVQEISGGRVTLGIGLAHKEMIEQTLKVPFERPARNMAEYLSVGRDDPHTAMWMRDAILQDDFPTIQQLTTEARSMGSTG